MDPLSWHRHSRAGRRRAAARRSRAEGAVGVVPAGTGASRASRRRAVSVVSALALAGAVAGGTAGCGVADQQPRSSPVRTSTSAQDPVAARAEVTYVAECDVDSRVKRPATFVLACADGGEILENITWRAWGEDTATATADLVANDCNPDCARGKDVATPVDVVADQLVEGEGAAMYRRLRVTVDSAGGEGGQQVFHLPGIEPEGDPASTGSSARRTTTG